MFRSIRFSLPMLLAMICLVILAMSVMPALPAMQPLAVSSGLTIHFKKPATWTTAQLYYYDQLPATVAGVTWTTAPTMTSEGNGWFVYTIPGASSARVMFKDNTNKQIPGATQPGFLRSAEGWYDASTSTWSETDPNTPTPPPSPDTQAPTAPSNLAASGVTATSVTLSWTAASDNVAVTNYLIFSGNTQIGQATSLTFTTSGLTASTSYSFSVQAADAAGNQSPLSSALSVTTAASTPNPPNPPPASSSSFSWDNATVYFVLTDRFFDGDSSNNNSYGRPTVDANGKKIGTFQGGDIKGLTQKLKEGYFSDLGVNAIWLTAPYEQVHGFVGGGNSGDFAHYAYHGYYALDYTYMDQNMGTVEEMREFVDLAHSKGIRVVLDVVMNHSGYGTIKDMEQYGFGGLNGITSAWTPGAGQTFFSYNNYVNYSSASAWSNWWGTNWIRTGLPGYNACGNSDQTMCLAGLPDFLTENTAPTTVAPLLQTKWGLEQTGFDSWRLPAADNMRQNLNVAPAEYITKWLGAWVREFGIDGFRIDTAKHVELGRWKQLKTEANSALQAWRQANPSKPGATWSDNFWMTGEVWGAGVGRNSYFDNGFDSLINFSFQGVPNNMASLDNVYLNYAGQINSDPTMNALSYISSHDTSLYNRNNLVNGGTALLLAPGGVQIFYGDETGRPFGETGSDSTQGTRSFMNWSSVDQAVLAHWQKVGQFRNNHLAIGAGSHAKLQDAPYAFSRKYSKNGVEDQVVVVLGASGTVSVNVGTVFADGTMVRDFYTDETATVTGGKATFAAHANGVLLIEQSGPVVPKTVVSAIPGDSTFYSATMEVTLIVKDAPDGVYTLDGSDPAVSGLSFTNNQKLTIGGSMAIGDTLTLRVYATSANGTDSKTYTYQKIAEPAGLTIYFKKPASWATARIYYYNTVPATVPAITWTTSPAMSLQADGWYKYKIIGATSAYVMFKDDTGLQIPGAAQPGYFRTADGWFDGTTETWSNPTTPPSLPTDTIAPTAPTNVSMTDVTATSISISWTASTDNVAVVGYEIYANGVLAGTSTSTPVATNFTLTGLSPATSYAITIRGRDAAGNASVASTPLLATTLDTEPPTVPTGLNATNIGMYGFKVEWTAASDNLAVKGYDVYLNGLLEGTTSSVSFTFSGLTMNATYVVSVVAFDEAANRSLVSDAVSVTTAGDTLPPSVPTGLVRGTAGTTGVTVQWNASADNVALAGYEVYLGGVLQGSTGLTSYTLTGLPVATNVSVTVAAYDLAGNRSLASSPLTFSLPDQTAPTVPSNLTASNLSSTAFRVNWTASTDNIKVVGYNVYQNGAYVTSVSGSTTSYVFSALTASTTYKITLLAYDAAGNRSARSTELTVSTLSPPDKTPPTVPTSLSSSNVRADRFTVTWIASTDNVGVSGYNLYLNGIYRASVGGTATSYTFTGLTASTLHSVTVLAYDAAKNKSAQSPALLVTTAPPADTLAPSVPAGLSSSNVSKSGFRVSWSASTDNIAVRGYNVYRNGAYVASVGAGTLSYNISGLAANTSYGVTVLAYDAAGNRSARSAVLQVLTLMPN